MEFITYLTERYQPATVKRYQREVELYLTYLQKHGTTPEIATYSTIMNYIGKLRTHIASPKCPLHAIKGYHSFLVTTGVRIDNPAKAIRLRDKASRAIQLQDLFTSEELEVLLERKERYSILKHRNKLIISLLIYQGLACSEISSLLIDDIDMENATEHIRSSSKRAARTLKLQSNQVFWLIQVHHRRSSAISQTT